MQEPEHMGSGTGSTALVTGAARGIGRAIAIALSRSGMNVVVNDLPDSRDLVDTVKAISDSGGHAVAVPFDISELAEQDRFVAQAWSAFDGLHCLVNNAGVSVKTRADLLDVTPESFDRLIDINLRGPFFLTQKVAGRMLQVRSDVFRSIVTISSINVEFASIDRAEYCISKTGLAMMSRLFAVRLAAERICSYEVRPGVIRTDMTAVARDKYDRLIADGLTPIRRWGEPDDVGRAVAALASGAFGYTTGETVRVDGGLAVGRL